MSIKKGLADKILDELAMTCNNFKTAQDRKYSIYTLFRYRTSPFKVEKLIGSNQVLLYDHNNKTVYNSDNETLEQQTQFRQWLKKQVIVLLLCILPNGLNS